MKVAKSTGKSICLKQRKLKLQGANVTKMFSEETGQHLTSQLAAR